MAGQREATQGRAIAMTRNLPPPQRFCAEAGSGRLMRENYTMLKAVSGNFRKAVDHVSQP
jgi:hypothetical protein